MPTFYLEESFSENDLIPLQGKEAWHALGVRRVAEGDSIKLIDGHGKIGEAIVEQLESKHAASIRVVKTEFIDRPAPDIILATAIAKGDRQSTLLDMATQLGISAWQPLLCERSVSKVGKNSFERWQRICLEACKQSGSAWLPELHAPAKPEEIAQAEISQGRAVLLAHPDGEVFCEMDNVSSNKKMLMIGPEGGFTTKEVQKIVAVGAKKINLGSNILRIETAAVSFVARCHVQNKVI
jgi:16S rRNA (uracil1498-N3)-methyltransferase